MRMMMMTDRDSGKIMLLNPNHCRAVFVDDRGSGCVIDFGDHDDATMRTKEAMDDVRRIWARSMADTDLDA